MHTLFLISSKPPATLDDDELSRRIQLLFLRIESILIEMKSAWNRPNHAEVLRNLRQQLTETAGDLNAATDVWEMRQITMR